MLPPEPSFEKAQLPVVPLVEDVALSSLLVTSPTQHPGAVLTEMLPTSPQCLSAPAQHAPGQEEEKGTVREFSL